VNPNPREGSGNFAVKFSGAKTGCWIKAPRCSSYSVTVRGHEQRSELVGPGCVVFLYCISLGLCSYSSAVGTKDWSKCRFKGKKEMVGFAFALLTQSSLCLVYVLQCGMHRKGRGAGRGGNRANVWGIRIQDSGPCRWNKGEGRWEVTR